MSSIEGTPIDDNKDFDEDIDDTEVWTDEYLQIVISNQLIDNKDNKYINQAKEKFQYFRINSPSVVYNIDVGDLDEQIIKRLEDITGHIKTIEQKYNRVDSIFAASIYLIYKNQVLPQLLSTTLEDHVIVTNRINEMPSIVSGKWRLTDSDKKLQTSGSCLSEIIGYVSSLSSVSIIKEPSESNDNINDKGESKEKGYTKYDDNGNNTVLQIIELIKERCIEIFQDQFNELYVTFKINSHVECMPLESDRFKNVIRKEYFEQENKVIKEDNLNGILKLIEAQLMHSEDIKKIELKLRVAKTADNGSFYYDLTNPKWEVIKITSEGWNIVKDNTIPLFKRYENNYSPQVYPSKENDNIIHWNSFLKLFNLESKNDILLLSVYIISLFIPDISRGILLLNGSWGGAKTKTFEMIKNIVDPGTVDTFSFPEKIEGLVQILSHHHLNLFDNVSSISEEISNLLCTAVTGSGYIKRALYKNDTDVVYKFKRGVGINGINLVSTRPDLLDRSLIIKLKRIPKEERRKKEDIDREFEELRPYVLGYIFDILVKVLKFKEENKGKTI